MWKFKASKFKNAAPKIPRKEEWVTDVRAANLLQSCGNHIGASAVYATFNTDAGGVGSLGILPLTAKGRQNPGSIPHLRAHAGFVTDLMYSPFDDFKLATTSHDGLVKIWQLPPVDELGVTSPVEIQTLSQSETHVEVITWNPTAEGILATAANKTLSLYDVESKQINDFEHHTDSIQGVSWRGDGSVIVTSSRDKKIRIFDPRANNVVSDATGHPNMRDSRVVWLGNKDHIVSTGFDTMRSREVSLRDCRNMSSPICTKGYDTSASVFIPLYDADTGMMFVASKGDTCLRYMEATNTDIMENFTDTVEQIKGICLVPKRAMDVMKCEVNRVMLLSQHALIPLPYHVPRKSYTEYHGDLYPDTPCGVPALSAQQWKDGKKGELKKMSLNPATKPKLILYGDSQPSPSASQQSEKEKSAPPTVVPAAKPAPAKSAEATPAKTTESAPVKPSESAPDKPSESAPVKPSESAPDKPSESASVKPSESASVKPSESAPEKPSESAPPKPTESSVQAKEPTPEKDPVKPSGLLREKKSNFCAVRQSKFRHLQGKPDHKDYHIDNLRNLSKSVPGESDLFYANPDFCVVPLAGSGGLVAVLKVSEVGRLPDTGVPALQNGCIVMDAALDPFNNRRLAIGCDDAKIRIWTVPEEGLTTTLTDPDQQLIGHNEKIYFVKFHPLASDVLASGSYDMTVRIWDLNEGVEKLQLTGHTDTIFALEWSPNGQFCATVCKDGKLRIYEPRSSSEPIKEGVGPKGPRGARVVWACDGKLLVVTGFSRNSERQILVYSVDNIESPVHTHDLDTSPAILIPHMDQDSSTIFLSARGERTVQAFEVVPEAPYLYPLSSYHADGLHQALAFLPKNTCNVAKVEFARALRLTQNTIEPIGFTVPRVKTEFFQDDLYPDTQVTWEPVMSANEWFSGENKPPKTMSLRPTDMKLLSEAPVGAPKPKKYDSYNPDLYKTEEQKKEELLGAMMGKFEVSDSPLEQDMAEGVDEDEWDD